MKKFLSVLLAVVMAFGCFAVGAFAEETTEPELSASGYYVGQILKAGDQIKSKYTTCESLIVKYYVSTDDRDNVTSELQSLYAADDFKGVVSFRDNVASFTSGELYKGVYTVLGVGDQVGEMETENGKYKAAVEIKPKDEKDEDKEIKLFIDYEYKKTTLLQYTSIVGWEITKIGDYENSLSLELKAVFETREPNGFESFLESLYVKWLEYLDWVGDILIKIIPPMVEFWAKLLGK